MLTTLILGILITALVQGVLWGGFIFLRKFKTFGSFNSREANKRMLQLTLALYFICLVATIYFMF
jgi:dolichyl-phosphate-mannose--protein O-mannosyl transferase